MISDTELRLSFWRNGSIQAERLSAGVLRLSGYEEIDPQSPLGGPDGKKDILCQKGGLLWVGAVYFPNAPVRFTAIKKKFQSDFDGAPGTMQGFAFVTNQTLTPTQRATLSAIAKASGKECDIVHLQQMQSLLDSPMGYGLRIQYLSIGMSIEEQLSWAVDSDSQTAKALTIHTRELLALRASVERINAGQSHIIRTLGLPLSAATPDLISVSSFTKKDAFAPVSFGLTPELVLLFHRLTCFDLPSRVVGQLRTRDVWLGTFEGKRATHIDPPSPEEVQAKLEDLCTEWRTDAPALRSNSAKLEALARFHARLLLVHPFVDGNGRVARAILMQQCLDLFDKADMSLMNKGAEYYSALREADGGDFKPLADLIAAIVKK